MWEFSWRQEVYGDVSKDTPDIRLSQVVKCWGDSGKLQNWADGQQVAYELHHKQIGGMNISEKRSIPCLHDAELANGGYNSRKWSWHSHWQCLQAQYGEAAKKIAVTF